MNRLKSGLLAALLVSVTAQGAQVKLDEHALGGLEPLVDPVAVPAIGEAPVLLQFWASWCHSCAGLMWDMDELLQANPEVQYLAISLDDDSNDAVTYISRHALFSKYREHYFHDEDKTLAETLGVETVPTILLIDRNGEVAVRKAGHLNAADKQDLSSGIKAGF